MEIFQRREKSPELIRKLKSVFSLFRVVDIMFFIFALTGTVFWIIYLCQTRNLIRTFDINTNMPIDYLTNMRDTYKSLSNYINFNSTALILFTFRLTEYLHFAGSMKVITLTLHRSIQDLFYFFLMFGILVLGFTGMANVVFGNVDLNFTSFGDSFMSCLLVILGEFDITTIQKERRLTSLFFVFFFLIIFTFVLLNILLAILEINFSLSKIEVSKQDEKVRKVNVLLCCCMKLPESGLKIEEDKQKADLHAGLNVLDEMNVLLNSVSHSLRWWADGLAQQIYSETTFRKEFRKDVINKAYKVPAGNIGDEGNEDARNAVRERKKYFHYLRVGSQFMDYQCESIEDKMREVDGMVRQQYEIYIQKKKEYYRIKRVQELIKKQLDERKKLIHNKLEEQKELNKQKDMPTETLKSMADD